MAPRPATTTMLLLKAHELAARVRTLLYSKWLALLFQHFGKGARITPPFRFNNLFQIALEEHVIIANNCWFNVINPDSDDCSIKIHIGANTGLGMGVTLSAASKISLGKHVLLARNVYISDHAHAFADTTRPISHQGIDGIRPVTIGDETWLGHNVVVLPGVSIGKHCVVGANSVVRDSIPDYCVAVGAPAKIVKRYNFESGKWEKPISRQLEHPINT